VVDPVIGERPGQDHGPTIAGERGVRLVQMDLLPARVLLADARPPESARSAMLVMAKGMTTLTSCLFTSVLSLVSLD
jgi:hypothetical protein